MLPRHALVVVLLALSCSSGGFHDRPDLADVPKGNGTKEAVVLAHDSVGLLRLGKDVVVAHGGELSRVDEAGALEPLDIGDMPRSARVMSRRGEEVWSGQVTALLGDSLRSFWIGWSTYSIFGSTHVFAVDRGRARCVGFCGGVDPDEQAWSQHADAEYEGSGGEMLSHGGRGRLFVVTNLVSGEGDAWMALPDPLPSPRADAARQLIHVGSGGVAQELVDGTIVHVDGEHVTCLSRGTRTVTARTTTAEALPWKDSIVALGCKDVATLATAGAIWRERDGVVMVVQAPPSVEHLHVDDDGALWASTDRQQAFRYDAGAWREVRWSAPPETYDHVLAITKTAIFTSRRSKADPATELLVRVSL